jgi:hypothetical protein
MALEEMRYDAHENSLAWVRSRRIKKVKFHIPVLL